MDAPGDLAQFLQRGLQPGGHAVQLLDQPASPRGCRRLGLPQPQGEGDQTLLGAVVQIALDAAPGLVRGDDDAGAGGSQRRLRLGVGDRG
ncbi:MAG: hypothetical protein KGK09_12625, partial [Burkholderiales bacterium]|nr:hypothetical protein [Burkholderiales bacterium]